jgi:hypothetical protein
MQEGDGDGHDNGNVTLFLLGYSLLFEWINLVFSSRATCEI